jgi:type I restriction enzyme S subunit
MPEKPCPPGWAWVALLDVAEMATGHTPSRQFPEYWSDGDIPWVTATDANPADGGVINDTLEKINRLGLENSAAVLLPKGTVCLSRTGASIGYTVILGSEMATNQGFVNYICSEALCNHYLLHLFMAERRALFSFGEGSAHKTIYFPEAKAFHICLPPLPEQHRIVEKIDELFSDLDTGVVSLQRAKANLKRYRASVLKSAVEGRLTEEWRKEHPQTEDGQMLLDRILRERREKWEKDQLANFKKKGKEPPENWQCKYEEPSGPDTSESSGLPKGWFNCTLGEVCEVSAGVGFPNDLQGQPTGDYPFFKVGDISEAWQAGRKTLVQAKHYVSDDDLVELKARPLRESSVVFAKIGAAISLNRRAVLGQPSLVDNNCMALWAPVECVVPDYVFYFTCTLRLGEMSRASVVPSLRKSDVEPIRFPLPPLAEQAQIVTLVEERLSQIESAERTIDAELIRAKRLRQSILKQAFEGKLVPQDPNDEPASVLMERIRASREAEQPKKKAKKVKAK